MHEQSTIVALATPYGTSGVAVLRLSGSDALAVAQRIFRSHSGKRLNAIPGYTGTLGYIMDGEELIDEAIVYVYRAPKSYTGEDIAEISLHGGAWLAQRVLRLCMQNGAVAASPGEFTKRAFLNGKMDLSQAEAVMDLISANGDASAKAAINALKGRISTAVSAIVEKLLAQATHLSAWSDYPDEGLEEVDEAALEQALRYIEQDIGKLIATYDRGRLLHEGVTAALLGKPNVGKSTLMNLLSGYERSIVTEIPGTTRDVVTESVRVGDFVLRLTDTAGLRDTNDPIEKIGVERSREQLECVQIVLAVFDYSNKLEEEDLLLLQQLEGKPAIAVINKTDLKPALDLEQIHSSVEHVVMASAKAGEGYDALLKAINELLGATQLDLSSPVIASERQYDCLVCAKNAVSQAITAHVQGMTLDAINVCLDEALDELLSLTGERASERVIDEIFERFCVGK